MNKTLVAVLVGLLVIIVIVLVMVVPATRRSAETPFPTVPPDDYSTPLPTLLPSPSPSPVALTPEQEQLSDLEAAEKSELALGKDFEQDVTKLDAELRGL